MFIIQRGPRKRSWRFGVLDECYSGWNTNLVRAVELRLFANTKIPPSVNVQVYCSLPPPVRIWQRNTLTNAFAANAYLN